MNNKFVKNPLFLLIIFLIACEPSIRFTSKRDLNDQYYSYYSVDTTKTEKQVKTKKNKSQVKLKKDKLPSSSGTYSEADNYIKKIAESWIGVKYKYGGDTRDGVDCSGFVKSVYVELGQFIPRTSYEQYLNSFPTNNPRVGDLVFFKKNDKIYHVGLYVGNDMMIHASSSLGVVKQSFKQGVFASNYAGIRTINK